MHTFYLDKNNNFECQIEVQGADINTSKSRLLLENEDGTIFLFNGTLNKDGDCNINLDNIKKHLIESDKGILKLEVIVEDTIFTPYESNFNIDISKKVTVSEVKKTDLKENSQPKIAVKVKVQEKNPYDIYINEFKEFISKAKNKDFDKLLEFYIKKRLNKQSNLIITEITKSLQTLK